MVTTKLLQWGRDDLNCRLLIDLRMTYESFLILKAVLRYSKMGCWQLSLLWDCMHVHVRGPQALNQAVMHAFPFLAELIKFRWLNKML